MFIVNQAMKIYSIRITGFHYSYFTVRVMTNDSLVPVFLWKGNGCPYMGNGRTTNKLE